ncbi:hypothetical protein [Photobacterium sp. TLY01]|uniref:hypothetical protein n=1 Tax=Photobacterium sp. TLY01 TaxID=2907534 RepID=UPI001F18A72F|nr:hypothetical protein [Photobacterium sp. TLY01]UIP27584.1 hypothetical protein LN341_13330 [Photobacterium sp. TLY01]
MTKVDIVGIGRQLFSPLFYLTRFEHKAKAWYDIWYPLLFTVLTVIFLFFLVDNSKIPSLIKDINGFLGNLPGFFIAALAAIATFGNSRIDEEVGGVRVRLKDSSGELKPFPVSRRRFLSSMFSYLTGISFFIVIGAHIALRIQLSNPVLEKSLNWTGFFVFFFFVWQLVLTSFLGLYYLGERLHESD